jgi:hypothetical protein
MALARLREARRHDVARRAISKTLDLLRPARRLLPGADVVAPRVAPRAGDDRRKPLRDPMRGFYGLAVRVVGEDARALKI